MNIPVTTDAYAKLDALDKTLVGTPDYLGVAFFWAYEYRALLRPATPAERKRVHDKLLAAGLAVNGISDEHHAIINRVCGKRARKVYLGKDA